MRKNEILNNKGFTMIEVAVTIIIICMLLLAIFPVIKNSMEQWNERKRVLTAIQVLRGVQQYYKIYASIPSITQLQDIHMIPSGLDTTGIAVNYAVTGQPDTCLYAYRNFTASVSDQSFLGRIAGVGITWDKTSKTYIITFGDDRKVGTDYLLKGVMDGCSMPWAN